jgi:hypothetical protein
MTHDATLKQRFTKHVLDLNYEIGVQAKAMGDRYRPTRMRQMLRNRGGLETAQLKLAGRTPQPRFHRTIMLGLPDLSLEVAVLQRPWRALFTPQQLAEARSRLEAELAYLRQTGQAALADRLDQVLGQLGQ